ncbi:neither inactivation nor afterpotential protein C-like isoform X2 [Cotesia glomerata]|uniref:neither inactivation nor afterpotential protein C-like isoform X2 n=1 Tax=Cotesia glomerata TaxID=32391 RepID=UPI001D02C105|nr:neither inactivation nor afterpotential protein C-like isoform X2 [Cotesia glomerata]
MNKKYGIFQIIDQASRQSEDVQFIVKKIECYKGNSHVKILNSHEFSVAHYTGKVNYDIADIVERNRDFVSPEMINTMRLSTLHLIKQMFFGKLSRTGNLISESNLVDQPKENEIHKNLMPLKLNKNRVIPKDQYSQTKKMRSCTSTFRNVCLEILNNLSVNQKNIGIHFIRCIRADLKKEPWGFNQYIVKQQVKALGVIETACTRQEGYAYRIPFREFLRRYQFLAFDFGEKVDISKENCRLLLIRLKMEGWMISRSKVFLKYYNEEYLSRLYETQVRKIIKIQSMLRAFLACKKLNKAAQKKKINAYRGHVLRKELHTQKRTMEYNTFILIQFYCIKWKLKSVYQILLQYRAIRFHQLVQMSQQVHLFNRSWAHRISTENPQIDMNNIELNVEKDRYLGRKPRSVYKLPFNFYQDFLNFDAAHLTEQSEKLRKNGSDSSASDEDNETWDSSIKREIFNRPSTKKIKKNIGVQTTNSPHRKQHTIMKTNHSIINSLFIRDPRTSSNPLQEKDLHNNRFTKCVLGNQHPMITHGEWNGNAAASEKSQNLILGNEANNNFADITRFNAVHELQSIGKKKDHTELDEEQPYNFQALLRKTPYQRPSMKRNQIYESDVQSFSRPRNQSNKSHITTNKTAIIKTNELENINSCPTENFNVLTEDNLTNKTFLIDNFNTNNYEKCDLTIEKNINDRQQYKSIDTDDVSSFKLAPGVIVEGYCADF